nr:hypothetical protein [Gordonia polyisoprenivorans]
MQLESAVDVGVVGPAEGVDVDLASGGVERCDEVGAPIGDGQHQPPVEVDHLGPRGSGDRMVDETPIGAPPQHPVDRPVVTGVVPHTQARDRVGEDAYRLGIAARENRVFRERCHRLDEGPHGRLVEVVGGLFEIQLQQRIRVNVGE